MPEDIISINNSIIYILYGIFIIVFAVFEVHNNTLKNKKHIILILVILYIFIFAFRGYIGYDWVNYLHFYEKVPLLTNSDFWYSFSKLPYEYGFNLYVTLLKNICDSYIFYTFVNSIINITLIIIFIRRYSDLYAFSFLIFLVMGGLIFEIDFMRNMKSILLFLLSIKYIEERRFILFLVINLLGVLFHASSLLYIPLYFIINKKFSLILFWGLFIVGNIIFLLQLPYLKYIIYPIGQFLGGRFAFLATLYFEVNDIASYGISIGYIERISTAVIITIFYSKLVSRKTYNLIFVNCILYYLVIFFYFGEIRMITLRLPYLFFFSYAILLPQIYQLIYSKMNRQLFFLLIIFYSIMKIHGLTSGIMYNYDNILLSPSTKEERTYNMNRAFIYL